MRFELTTFFRSTYFQDKRHKPDSTKCPVKEYTLHLHSCITHSWLGHVTHIMGMPMNEGLINAGHAHYMSNIHGACSRIIIHATTIMRHKLINE